MLIKQKIPFFALKKILEKFNLNKIKKVKPLTTSGNITYIIESAKERYLLRLCPLGERWRSEEEIAAELELIKHLFKNRFPVSKPIMSQRKKYIIFWENHFGYLRKFIIGQAKLTPSLLEVKKFGKLIGQFHNLVKNYQTKNKRKHLWNIETIKKNFKEDKKLILASHFKGKEKFIKKFEKEIFKLKFPKNLPQGMIHEDLGKRHVLWHKNKIVGLIDFDRCYYGKLVLDLGQACRGWCFTNNWMRWSNENFGALISSYQKKRKLTNLEGKYLVDAVKFGILERALSFSLRFRTTQDRKDEKYAIYSVSDNGLLGILEKNREKIEQIIKTT